MKSIKSGRLDVKSVYNNERIHVSVPTELNCNLFQISHNLLYRSYGVNGRMGFKLTSSNRLATRRVK